MTLNNNTQLTKSIRESLVEYRPTRQLSWQEAKKKLTDAATFDDDNTRMVNSFLDTVKDRDLNFADWKEAARFLCRSKQYDVEQLALYNAFALNSDDVEVQSRLMYTFRMLKDYERAITLYSQRLLEDPTNASAIEKLGNMYFETGDYVSASHQYKTFLMTSPNDNAKEKLLVESQRLVRLALTNLSNTNVPVSPDDLAAIRECTNSALGGNSSSTLSWQKIANALVLAAAITSALADLPSAAKNIKDAMGVLFEGH